MASSVSWILVTSPLLWLLFASSFAAGETRQRGVPKSTAGEIMKVQATGAHLTADDTILDLLNHPAFAGFARLLLPWDDRGYDNSMRLRNIGSLLPYHSHVDPGTVVSALNHMIDDVNNGKTIFYEFYTEEEKKLQRTKSNTGLFFFRGKPGAPFAIVAPGGGFSYVGSFHEGFPYAVAISKQGYNAFVLRYRAGAGGAVATRDLAAAISFVFRNAKMLGRRHRRIFLVGQFGGRKNGGRHRLERGGEVRGRRPPQAIGSGDGLHGPFGVHGRRAAHFRRGRRARCESRLRLSWSGESPRYAAPVPKWNSISTADSGMVSVPVPVRVQRDGSTVPSDSGRGSSSPASGASPGCRWSTTVGSPH